MLGGPSPLFAQARRPGDIALIELLFARPFWHRGVVPLRHVFVFGQIGLAALDNLSYCLPMANQITWQLVDAVAADLGASEPARQKWRQPGRGVPPIWQIKIVQELMRRSVPASLDDFAGLPENPGRIAA